MLHGVLETRPSYRATTVYDVPPFFVSRPFGSDIVTALDRLPSFAPFWAE